MVKLYRVKDWNELYENNRTRELKSMAWVPVPNSHDGDGYTELVDRENGAAILGAWLVILQVASRCDVRGTLSRQGAMPHDARSLSRMTRIPEPIISQALDILTNEVKWLEYEELPTIPHNPAPACGKVTKNRTEGNGTEQKEEKEENGTESVYSASSRVALHYLNEQSGKHFRECESSLAPIAARLKEPEVTIEGVKQMIDRQCQLWRGDRMEEYLRPQTLFGKEKFDGYYAARMLPINGHKKDSSPTTEQIINKYL